MTDNGGNVSIGGNAAITVISTEGDATGLGNYHYDTADGRSAGRTEINGAAHVNVASTGNGGVGVFITTTVPLRRLAVLRTNLL
ncbi:MAG: hypothetical protein ACLR2G_00670 [Phascolarctobacterium faecium]